VAKIKTHDTAKDIKIFDHTADISTHMKNTFVKSKNTAEQTQEPGYNAPESYATDTASSMVQDTAEQATHKLKNPVQKASKNINQAKQNLQDAKQHISDAKNTIKNNAGNRPEKEMGKQAQNTARRTAVRTRQATDQSIRTVQKSDKVIKRSAKTVKEAEKGAVKTAQKSVKTAERTTKTAVKTTQQAAKTAQKTVQASAKAAKAAVQASRTAAKAAAQTAKIVVKVTIATVKAIIAATKALISAIAAGGWIAVVLIIVICMIGLIAGSCFGIFFSGNDSGTGQTMQTAVREINEDYDTRLEETKADYTYDVLEMSGSRAVWKEVLAIYAVKTTTGSENPQEVATVDDNKKKLLKSIFWEMNEINSRTEVKTETQTVESDDGHGNIMEKETIVTRTYLYITVSHKTADEMADKYSFNTEQRQQLSDLLADENNSLWSQVLYGITSGDDDIIVVALSQVGNIGGQPYWSWYGFSSRVPWCACFVSWCANECGYIDAGIIPKFAACTSQGVSWFKERGEWRDNSYIPSSGDIIFFDWERDGEADHVGIVEKVENGMVYTIEGNSSDSCRQNSYSIGYFEVYGYGIPAY
jgi:hypothetical protein